jgi:hypothetical protein
MFESIAHTFSIAHANLITLFLGTIEFRIDEGDEKDVVQGRIGVPCSKKYQTVEKIGLNSSLALSQSHTPTLLP